MYMIDFTTEAAMYHHSITTVHRIILHLQEERIKHERRLNNWERLYARVLV